MIVNRPIQFYDENFQVTPAYKATMPDMQNGPSSTIEGSPVPIQQVGIHNFRLPLRYAQRGGGSITLETAVTGTVSLDAHRKGIDMSRIMRTFYQYQNDLFWLPRLEGILRDYQQNLGTLSARIILRFRYPILNPSLRSELAGYQYYDVAFEGHLSAEKELHRYMHFDFVYSSACPCSYELAQHAIETRGIAAVPHSQRSVTRISVRTDALIWIEELRDLCLSALQTETQVMVKREDEQAFAEMNAAYLKFVEDAVRLLYERLANEPRILDFKVIASHQESLHSHDAVSVIVKGVPGGFSADLEPNTLASLIHKN